MLIYNDEKKRNTAHSLEVEQRVHGFGLGVVVLSVHFSPVLRPPLSYDDCKSF